MARVERSLDERQRIGVPRNDQRIDVLERLIAKLLAQSTIPGNDTDRQELGAIKEKLDRPYAYLSAPIVISYIKYNAFGSETHLISSLRVDFKPSNDFLTSSELLIHSFTTVFNGFDSL